MYCGNTGEMVCLDVTAYQFEAMLGMQYTLQWNPDLLHYLGTNNENPALAGLDFGETTGLTSQGRLTSGWNDPANAGVTLSDGAVLYTVCFELVGQPGDYATISFGDDPTPVEFVALTGGSDFVVLNNYALLGGGIGINLSGSAPGMPLATGCINTGAACNPASAQLSLSFLPDNIPLTTTWTDGQGTTLGQDPVLDVLAAGRYAVQVAGTQGGSLNGLFNLEGLSNISISVDALTQANCATGGQGAVTVSAGGGAGGYTFEWSNGATGPSISNLPPDVYTVTVTDDDGCTATETVEIEAVDFLPAHAIECTYFSDGASISDIQLAVWSGGVPPYTFSWSSGETEVDSLLSSITVQDPAIRTVTITDQNGCGTTYGPIETEICDWNTPADGVAVFLTSTTVAPGSSICIPVKVNHFDNLTQLQFSLDWDAAALELTDILAVNLPSNWDFQFDSTLLATGSLGFTASDGDIFGSSLPNGANLFTLCYDVLLDEGATAIGFGDEPWPASAQQPDGPVPVGLQSGAIYLDTGANGLLFRAPEVTEVLPGASFCLPVTTGNFDNIGGFQHTLVWDPAILQFDSLKLAGLDWLNMGSADNYNPNDVAQGQLRILWFDQSTAGVTYNDYAVPVYEVCFTALNPGVASVGFANAPVNMEAYRSDLSPVGMLGLEGNVIVGDNLVWPGDTDDNQTVSHYDLLNIGLGFGATGPPRPGASLNWVGQPATEWGQTTPVSEKDFRHIDTDGNGMIDALDTLALSQNWAAVTEFGNEEEAFNGEDWVISTLTGAPLYLQPDTLLTGQPAAFPIVLGEADLPVGQAYGLAFTIVYDKELVEENSVWVDFSDSWLGDIGDDLLTFYRNDPDDGRLHVALTRTNGSDREGYGPIGELRLTIEDVIFKNEVHELALSIENARLISYNETVMAMTPAETITVIEEGESTATTSVDGKPDIRVFPNPARHTLFLQSPKGLIQRVTLSDPAGKTVRQSGPTDRIDLRALPGGVYQLRIATTAGVWNQCVVVAR